MTQYLVAALYKFVRLEDYAELREPLQQLMQAEQIRGTLLLAAEGINGTVAGTRSLALQSYSPLHPVVTMNPP